MAMTNVKIEWGVDNVSVDNRFEPYQYGGKPRLEAKLTGIFVEGGGPVKLSDIHQDLQVLLSTGSALKIKKVIFNNPATIVFWEDGSKTVVKAQDDIYDPEKGLAMAISKKALGNKGNYFNEIKKWVGAYQTEQEEAKAFIDLLDAKLEEIRNIVAVKED